MSSHHFRGRFGPFSAEQNDFILRVFENYEPDPWAPWHVERAWLALHSTDITELDAESRSFGYSRLSADLREVFLSALIQPFTTVA